MKKLLLFTFFLFSSVASAEQPIFTQDYESAMQSNQNVLLIFGADWCGNCVKLKNDMYSINLDDYVICTIDADENKSLARKYKVRSYPTSIVIKNGNELARKIGYKKVDFENWVEKHRSN